MIRARSHRPRELSGLVVASLALGATLIGGAQEARATSCDLVPTRLSVEWPATVSVGQVISGNLFADPVANDANGEPVPLRAIDQLTTSVNGAAAVPGPRGGVVAVGFAAKIDLAAATSAGTIEITTSWRETYPDAFTTIGCPRVRTDQIAVVPSAPPRYLARIGFGGDPGFEVDYLALRLAGACELSPATPVTLTVSEPRARRTVQVASPCSQQTRRARTARWRISHSSSDAFRLELVAFPRTGTIARDERRVLKVSLRQGSRVLYRQTLRARWQLIPSRLIPAGTPRFRTCLRNGGRTVIAGGAVYCRTRAISLTWLSRGS